MTSVPTEGTTVPEMSTTAANHSVATALFGKTQRGLLALFFVRPDEAFYLREIVRTARIGQGAAQRELARWVEAGLLTRSRRGNQVYYQANAASPVFAELKGLTIKTAGVADVVCDALARLAGRITLAFIHGSLATGTENAVSDVDVVIVGDVSFSDVVAALHGAQDRIGREINPSVYSTTEFKKKIRAGHHFLTSALAGTKIFLVGGERELDRLGA